MKSDRDQPEDGPHDTLSYKSTIGQLIKDARIQREISLNSLALRSGISKGNLSLIENGKLDPGWKRVEKILLGLGITPLELFTPWFFDTMLQDLIQHPEYYDKVKQYWKFCKHIGELSGGKT